ncbi:MAG: alkaline phosphatase D family protein [Nitrospiraceae bacterium]
MNRSPVLQAVALISVAFLSVAFDCTSPSRQGLPPGSPFAEAIGQPSGVMPQGVATGDITDHSAVVWVRTQGPVEAHVEWWPVGDPTSSLTGRIRPAPRAHRASFKTSQEQDFTIKIALEGLAPSTRYRYEIFLDKSPASTDPKSAATGEFSTAAAVDQHTPVTLLWGGDLGGQKHCRGPEGGYGIFDVMRNQQPDFAVLLGDLIYGDDTCPSPPNAEGSEFVASSLDHYRAKHRYQRGSPAMQRFLAAVPVFAIWDDHEVRNNFAGPYDPLMPVGRQALIEYWPIRTGPDDPYRLYRQLRYGADLELFILDTRQYRSRNAEPDGPRKTMLGPTQLTWLLDRLTQSTATWKLIATSVPLSNAKGGTILMPGNDSWARGADGTGFQTELGVIVDAILSRRIRNVVWLAGDVHYVQGNAYDPNGDGQFDFHEFIAGPLSAATPSPVIPNTAFRPKTLFSQSGYMNFGKATVRGTSLEVTFIDNGGKARVSHKLTAQ